MPSPSLMRALQQCPPDKQVLTLMRELQSPEKDIIELVQKARSNLGPMIAKLQLKKAKVIPYGSAVNGLFTMGSDLDFFIHPGQPVNKDQAIKLVRKLADLLKECKKNGKPCYSDIVTMTNGRVPVVQFIHVGMKREININFTSHIGVNNSYLIKHLITLDARIRPMIVMLKTYFKSIKAASNLTTFNLYSLIIFALQNNPVPVLPPLMDFLPQDDNVLFEKRWPVRFELKAFQSKNTQSLMGLILHFCSFYAEFDFANRLVSPYCGNMVSVTKDSYSDVLDFECSEHQFNFNRQLNIQDFFVLCCNVGSDCTAFKAICKVHHDHLKEYEAMTDAFQLMNAFFARKVNVTDSSV